VLKDTGYLSESEFDSIHTESEEIRKLIGTNRKNTRVGCELRIMNYEPDLSMELNWSGIHNSQFIISTQGGG